MSSRSCPSCCVPATSWCGTTRGLCRRGWRGIACLDLTLHVGPGTFRPIAADRLEDHVLHAEWAELPRETAAALAVQRRRGGRIVAVGTTSARTLETAAASGTLRPFAGETD